MSGTEFSKRPVILVELTVDECSLGYNDGTCAAALAAGSECYKTRATCQDPANWTATTKTYRFIAADGPPIVGVSAYAALKAVGVSPTEIDQARGLGARGRLDLTFYDFADDDQGVDPYRNRRSAAPGGTFWRRWLKRNRYYRGRWLVVYEGYLDADGCLSLTASDTITRRYTIDTIEGPDAHGLVRLQAKDPLALLDRVQIPTATTGELVATLAVGGVAFDVTAGTGAEYGSAPFEVRIGDEILLVGTRTTDAMTDVSRAQRGTTAAEHAADAKVQLCKAWDAQSVATIWEDLLNTAGLTDTYLDKSGAATEVTAWLSDHLLTACLSEPTEAMALMASLMRSCACYTWWDAESQLVRLRSIRPPAYAETTTAVSDETIVQGSTVLTRSEERRRTRTLVEYGITDWSLDLEDPASYAHHLVTIDAAAEGTAEYDAEKADDVVFAFWCPSTMQSTLESQAQRWLLRVRDPIEILSLTLEAAIGDGVAVGDRLTVTSPVVVDDAGNAEATDFLVVGRKRTKAAGILTQFTAERDAFPGKVWYWAPESGATAKHAQWCDDNGYLTDGTEGWRWC